MSFSIVHVLSSFGMGGQERVALDLATGLAAAGHRVLTVSLAPPPDGPLAARGRAAFDSAAPVDLVSCVARVASHCRVDESRRMN